MKTFTELIPLRKDHILEEKTKKTDPKGRNGYRGETPRRSFFFTRLNHPLFSTIKIVEPPQTHLSPQTPSPWQHQKSA